MKNQENTPLVNEENKHPPHSHEGELTTIPGEDTFEGQQEIISDGDTVEGQPTVIVQDL